MQARPERHRRSKGIRGDHDILRRDECIERRNRADRANVVTADREFIAEEEAFEDRHAINKGQRLGIPHFLGGGEAAHRAGDDAKSKNFRVLRLLPPHREELRVRKRRLISANVTSQTGERNATESSDPRRIDARVARVVGEGQRSAAGDNVWLPVDHRNELSPDCSDQCSTSGSLTLEAKTDTKHRRGKTA